MSSIKLLTFTRSFSFSHFLVNLPIFGFVKTKFRNNQNKSRFASKKFNSMTLRDKLSHHGTKLRAVPILSFTFLIFSPQSVKILSNSITSYFIICKKQVWEPLHRPGFLKVKIWENFNYMKIKSNPKYYRAYVALIILSAFHC